MESGSREIQTSRGSLEGQGRDSRCTGTLSAGNGDTR